MGTIAGLDLLDRATGNVQALHAAGGRPKQPRAVRHVDVIYEDRDGYLWVGTSENGLNKFDRETEKFTQYHFDPNDKRSLSNDSILSIHQDAKGRLWIGTSGGGLNLYDPETGFVLLFPGKGRSTQRCGVRHP
ncbi:MAG: hypothetical protein MZV64_23430 [Ignavibacteriales bacterium]|nr:hypothetical protein [Ignavibacteriales bacterium]